MGFFDAVTKRVGAEYSQLSADDYASANRRPIRLPGARVGA